MGTSPRPLGRVGGRRQTVLSDGLGPSLAKPRHFRFQSRDSGARAVGLTAGAVAAQPRRAGAGGKAQRQGADNHHVKRQPDGKRQRIEADLDLMTIGDGKGDDDYRERHRGDTANEPHPMNLTQ